MDNQTTGRSVSECLISDHGADFFEKLKGRPNTRGQIYFIKAYSMAKTYQEVAELLNREGIKTLANRAWSAKRVSGRASALRTKGTNLPYTNGTSGIRGADRVDYELLKGFTEKVFDQT